MTLKDIFVEFEEKNIEIIKLDLHKELKGGYLCINEKRIVFINSNLTDIDLIHTLKSILSHIRSCTSSPDKFLSIFTKL